MSVFEKLRHVKNLVPDIDDKDWFVMTQKLANKWHYKKKKKVRLSKEEAKLYEVYIANKINPTTVYKWMLLTKVPSYLRMRIRSDELKQKDIVEKKRELRTISSVTEKDFMYQVKNTIMRYVIR
ncbi:MAG: hypothetical protein U9O94_02130 [Nanoarchaeota archaeon]|nr:hypothetical protein [Nanoarchaeota archaeon]